MAASVVSRLAGKALGDFLKSATTAISGAAAAKTADYLMGQRGAGGLIGKLAEYPETVSKVAGAAAPLAAAGTVLAGQRLLFGAPADNRQASTATVREYRPPAYASSAYVPGRLPLTNEQAGEMLLDQQRFQHQMQLIQARQNASLGVGTLRDTSGIDSIMNLANRIYG
jgi:hypothetical protein